MCRGPEYLGKIIVVDPENNYHEDVKIFQFYSIRDSSEIREYYKKEALNFQGQAYIKAGYINLKNNQQITGTLLRQMVTQICT